MTELLTAILGACVGFIFGWRLHEVHVAAKAHAALQNLSEMFLCELCDKPMSGLVDAVDKEGKVLLLVDGGPGCFHDVQLLFAHPQPTPTDAHLGPIERLEAQFVDVEIERLFECVNVDVDVVDSPDAHGATICSHEKRNAGFNNLASSV